MMTGYQFKKRTIKLGKHDINYGNFCKKQIILAIDFQNGSINADIHHHNRRLIDRDFVLAQTRILAIGNLPHSG